MTGNTNVPAITAAGCCLQWARSRPVTTQVSLRAQPILERVVLGSRV